MRATVEGMVTSVIEETKGQGNEAKKHTEILLLQEGERVQVRARLQGHGHKYDSFERVTFTGRVMAWGKRSGEADYMLMVDEVS